MKERNPALDYAKAVGIALVVLGHFLSYSRSGDFIYKIIYTFHMPLFFVISGICMTYRKNKGFRTIIKKDFIKLMLPYFIWSVVYLIFLSHLDWIETKEEIINIISFRGIAPIWFLADLFFAKTVIAFIAPALSSDSKRIAVLFVFSVLTIVLYHPVSDLIENTTMLAGSVLCSAYRLIPSVAFLLLGYSIGFHEKELDRYKIWICVACLVSFVFVNGISPHNNNLHLAQFGNPVIFLATGTLGSLTVIFFCRLLPKTIGVLSEIGRRSFDIMLLHRWPPVPFALLIARIIPPVNVIATTVDYLMVMICSFISSLIIERVRQTFAARNIPVWF